MGTVKYVIVSQHYEGPKKTIYDVQPIIEKAAQSLSSQIYYTDRAYPNFGTELYKIEDSGDLTLIGSHYDTSG